MSNSLPRTMRRNAAISGSTSTKSNSKVLGLTVPSLTAWLLPCVRVTVFSLGPAIVTLRSAEWWREMIAPFRCPEASRDHQAPLAALEPTLLVDDEGVLHPGWRQVVRHHLSHRLENLELVPGRIPGPERHNRLQRWAAGHVAGDLGGQDRGLLRQCEALAR